ncbi:MAG: peptidylprolyl isomerase [Methylococcales bacterium]|nr:peptidylprolyl isomerase [Methylococcales bacterium]
MFSIRHCLQQTKNLALLILLALPAAGKATVVEMQTNMGNIDIQLFDTLTPKTVANFLAYVNSGAYNNSFIQRSVPGFIIQGGGYTWDSSASTYATIPTLAPVVNEYHKPNVAGTIAMAKQSGAPNSATDQWFFNLANNAANLDNQNGGFTVFGQVIDNGMQVVKAIAALKVVNACGSSSTSCAFSNLPLISINSGYSAQTLVMVNAIVVISLQALTDEKTVPLTSPITAFTPSSTGVVHGVTLTNPLPTAVTVTLTKNSSTALVATVQANSTLNIPLQSGLGITKSDTLYIKLPTGSDYANNPLYLMFDAR